MSTDLGSPTSYLALGKGVPVFDSNGERIGVVEHVLADPGSDVFDGIIVDTSRLPGGLRFADADQVGDLYERGVLLKVPRAELYHPERNPGELEADPADAGHDRLRRAWNWISGNY